MTAKEGGPLEPQKTPTLYEHKARPQWGLAILAWEGRDKRRYQFQDGKLRTFKQGYYEKLSPVTETDGDPEDIARDLKSMLRASRIHREEAQKAAAAGVRASTTRASDVRVDDQIDLFKKSYPGGFEDPKYKEEVRGEGSSRELKRHRDPSVELAQKELGADSIEARISAGDFTGVRDALAEVMKSTDLVPVRDAKKIESISDDDAKAIAEALRDVLHGAAPFEARFTRWVDVLNELAGKPTWPMATAPLMLVHPEEHVCVRPTVFRRQAKRLAPDLRYKAKPDAKLYERFRTMSSVLQTRLEQAEMPAKDMVDIYELIWATLRRKALDELEDLTS